MPDSGSKSEERMRARTISFRDEHQHHPEIGFPVGLVQSFFPLMTNKDCWRAELWMTDTSFGPCMASGRLQNIHGRTEEHSGRPQAEHGDHHNMSACVW